MIAIESLTADRSAVLLAAKLQVKEPFFFVRYGDGALECMAGRKGATRDLENYSESLGAELARCWNSLMSRPDLTIVGDWQTASFDAATEGSRYREQYEALFNDAEPLRIHFEALLLMRESIELVNFYSVLKNDPRRKVFVGPISNAGAGRMLRAAHIVTPMKALFENLDAIEEEVMAFPFDILIYGAGMAGNIPAIRCWEKHPERTFINVGSAFDPLFGATRTRMQQLSPAVAQRMFRNLLF